MNPAIEIKNLSFSYGDTENQLKHINLSVEKGEVIVLTGPSGSGKSTLTRVINGLIPYFFTGELSGEVWLFGKNMAEIPSWERGKYVGNVFQDPRSQFFANEVAGEIAFGCENYGVPHDEIVKRVQDAAEALSITDLLEQKVRYLSYGMRQRVAIASAEAIDPDIYVMDEPSANLDMGATEDFAAFVCLLKKQGKTILIAEHRLYYLRDIADRIVYLNKGEIVSVMTPQEMNILPHAQVFEWGLRSMELLNLPFPANSGSVSFEDVTFRYDKTDVLKNISLSLPAGSLTAFVGASGAGKTTAAQLIPKFWEVAEGSICIDGKNILELKNDNLMDLVSFVFQETFTLHDSIYENIAIGNKEATPQQVEDAARAAQIHDFIMSLPNGYKTKLGEDGVKLSGGEKQRICIARAILKDSPIIIFDEATSFADMENEHKIQLALSCLLKGKTTIMIAHRLHTITGADQICVFHEGRLLEKGKHDELVSKGGRYADMWRSYTQEVTA